MMQYIALVCLAGAVQATSSTRTPDEVATNTTAFAAATRTAKVATLSQLAAHRLALPTDDVVEIVLAGMTDREDSVRVAALGAAGGRLAAARFSKESNTVGSVEQSIVQRLRSPLLSSLTDRVPKARQLAIIALVNLEYEAGSSAGSIRLSDEVAKALASQYAVEQSALVRVEIAKSLR